MASSRTPRGDGSALSSCACVTTPLRSIMPCIRNDSPPMPRNTDEALRADGTPNLSADPSGCRLAGSSAGALICACNALVPMNDVEQACRDLVADLRKNGTFGRLRGTLEGILTDLLPEDAHERVRVGVPHSVPVAPERLCPFGCN